MLRCIAAAWLAVVCTHAGGQPVSRDAPGTVSASHERLTFFEGTWTIAELAPDLGFRETCAWLAQGRRHMVCRSRWQSAAGPREGFSVFSYDGTAGEYLYHGFRAGGAVVTHRGNPNGLGWQFTSDRGSGVDRVQTRVSIQPADPEGFRFVEETATGEGPWKVGAQVLYKRVAE